MMNNFAKTILFLIVGVFTIGLHTINIATDPINTHTNTNTAFCSYCGQATGFSRKARFLHKCPPDATATFIPENNISYESDDDEIPADGCELCPLEIKKRLSLFRKKLTQYRDKWLKNPEQSLANHQPAYPSLPSCNWCNGIVIGMPNKKFVRLFPDLITPEHVLWQGVHYGSIDCAKHAINFLGLSANYVFRDTGLSALHHAVSENHEAVVRTLIEHGADINITAAEDDATPLHCAAINNYTDLATYLLEHGADPTAKDTFGETPLDYARESGMTGVVKILKAHIKRMNNADQEEKA
jgi:hypothetical protein